MRKMAAVELGVPENHIIILEYGAFSTQDEAICLRNYLKDREEINSLILFRKVEEIPVLAFRKIPETPSRGQSPS